MAVTILAHMRKNGTSHIGQAEDVRVKLALSFLTAYRFNSAEDGEASVIDENIDAASVLNDVVDDLLALVFVSDVKVNLVEATPANSSGRVLRKFSKMAGSTVNDEAFLAQLLGNLESDA